MNRDGRRQPTIVWAAALLCFVVAVGAALTSRFDFTGARWVPDAGGEGTTVVKTPAPQPSLASAVPVKPAHHGPVTFSWLPLLIVVGVVVLALLAYLIWRWLGRRRRSGTPREVSTVLVNALDIAQEAEPDIPTLRRGLALASDALTTEREPRDAIIRAWIGLQEAAEDSGMSRRPAETPTEFTSRVFGAVRADRVAADTLLAVYLRVRFGSRGATAEDLLAARQAVAALSATWPVEVTR
jgi:hypothetical protein